MKKLNLIGIFVLSALWGMTQNIAGNVIEYKPAPGQHINIENIGAPQAAENMVKSEEALVSLGGFGGYIVLKFDEPCENDPENPYGIDFTIFGNAFNGSSEPGVIWVMKDENQNGLPDDTWYEIAGSHHFYSKTERNYNITYYKTDTRDVDWKDKYGTTDVLKANNYNAQEYYPMESYFPEYPKDSVSFFGTKMYASIDKSNPLEFKIQSLDFGYADNKPKKQSINPAIPDNPYSEEVEGAGGDPIDISWATDSLGNYVDLEEINFVKIVTGYLVDLGRLGEASTDVSYVVDVEPDLSIVGKTELLVTYYPPTKMLVGDTVKLEASYFLNGRILETEIGFGTSNSDILDVDQNGNLIAKNTGEAEIRVSAFNESKSSIIKVVNPESISLLTNLSSVYPGDTILLETTVWDNIGEKLNLIPVFLNQNLAVGKLISVNNKTFFIAENPGESAIDCALEKFQLQETFPLKVLSESDKIKIYLTIKTEEENLLALQWIEVGASDLNNFIEDRQKDFSGINRPMLAHAILCGLQKAQLDFVFKDDENSDGEFYLFSVENDGLFTYGWGGKTDPRAYAKAWIVRLNNKQCLKGFDKYQVADGDTVVLYHVSDITNQWQFSRLLASVDSIQKGETFEGLLEKTSCIFQGDTISDSGFIPVENEEIVADQIYFTDESGKAEVFFESAPPWIISSQNDAVLVSERITTAITQNKFADIQIFPNPTGQNLNLSGKDIRGSIIKIYNLSGQLLVEKKAESGFEKINLISIPSGFYHLSVYQNNSLHNFKFVKK